VISPGNDSKMKLKNLKKQPQGQGTAFSTQFFMATPANWHEAPTSDTVTTGEA
jgi:hypothetical protein